MAGRTPRPPPTPALTPAQQIIAEQRASSEAELRRQVAALKTHLAHRDASILELSQALDISELVAEATRGRAPLVIPRLEKRSALREGCAVILASDWHCGETVNPAQVFGRNEYNPSIFEDRSTRMGQAAETMIELNRDAFQIRRAVLWAGGDLMTGHIHEDLAISNAMGPADEILVWVDALERMIRRLVRQVDRLDVVCSFGNHGRMTMKPRVQTGGMLSFERLGYRFLQRLVADLGDRVHFHIAVGEHEYVDILGFTVRFTHGDAVRYQGGVGGIMIPLKKAVMRWDTAKRAHYTCVGHFHQYLDMGSIVANGSLIGYGPYSVRISAEYEPPQQAFFLMDSRRGKCQSTPLWVGRNPLTPPEPTNETPVQASPKQARPQGRRTPQQIRKRAA